jgi:hypothetical protein
MVDDLAGLLGETSIRARRRSWLLLHQLRGGLRDGLHGSRLAKR